VEHVEPGVSGLEMWDQIGADGQYALRLANATSRCQDRQRADVRDLLLGLMLAKSEDNPAREYLAIWNIQLSEIICKDGRTFPNGNELAEALESPGRNSELSTSGEVNRILTYVFATYYARTAKEVTVAQLFGGVLWLEFGFVAAALREAFSGRGIAFDEASSKYFHWLNSGTSLSDLRGTFGSLLNEPRIPILQGDRPRPRALPATSHEDYTDRLSTSTEVNAFAQLLCSTHLIPPLSIGIFGAWGAGKTNFMRSVQSRVDEISRATDSAPPGASLSTCRSIVQIEYNAWQYVEGDLWSSLLEHLFRNLDKTATGVDLFQERRAAVIDELRQVGDLFDSARSERRRLEGQLRIAEAEVEERKIYRELKLAELERRKRDEVPRAAISDALRNVATQVLDKAGIDVVRGDVEGLESQLQEAKSSIRNVGPLLAPLQANGGQYFVVVVVLLALPPFGAIILDKLDFSVVSSIASSVAVALGALAGYIRIGTQFVRARLKEIALVEKRINREYSEGRALLDAALADAQQNLTDADDRLRDASEGAKRLACRVAALEGKLAQTTPGKVFEDFISDRLGSDDYRSRLGLPALVRDDLSKLSQLMEQRRERVGVDEFGTDRIILYIDDLDRCPSGLVVDVLEAVQLLLAFPLFVVVVGVDSRWLDASLRTEYPQIEKMRGSAADFIEKIFQIPFWIESLSPDEKRSLVRGLIQRSVHSGIRSPNDQALAREQEMHTGSKRLQSLIDEVAGLAGLNSVAPYSDVNLLRLCSVEARQIEEISELLADTPRAIKRFVNVYLLVRAIGSSRGWVIPVDGQLALLAALYSSCPQIAVQLSQMLRSPETSDASLATVLAQERSRQTEASIPKRLEEWAEIHEDWLLRSLEGLTEWDRLVGRFRF
jgi:hypothetical protein